MALPLKSLKDSAGESGKADHTSAINDFGHGVIAALMATHAVLKLRPPAIRMSATVARIRRIARAGARADLGFYEDDDDDETAPPPPAGEKNLEILVRTKSCGTVDCRPRTARPLVCEGAGGRGRILRD